MEETKLGRPTVVTPEILRKLEVAFAIDCTVKEACSYAEIAQSTYYDYLLREPSFAERVERLRDKPVLKARFAAVELLDDSYSTAMDYLQRKRRDEFAPSQKVEVQGQINIALILNQIEHGPKIIEQGMADATPLLDTRQELTLDQVQAQPSTGALQPE